MTLLERPSHFADRGVSFDQCLGIASVAWMSQPKVTHHLLTLEKEEKQENTKDSQRVLRKLTGLGSIPGFVEILCPAT